MPHLPLAHHETSKCDSLNKTKIKETQNKTIPGSNLNLAKSMTRHNQTNELTTWFLIPHIDAIVVTIHINRWDLTRILVDNGSQVEILFLSAFKKWATTESN
jgi:hypothetical protein